MIIPNKQQASHQKDILRRKSQQITNNNKKDGFSKHNMKYDKEKQCYICPENQELPVKQVYPGKYNDRIIYYTNQCSKYPSKDICLTDKMTGKIITDYTSDAKQLQSAIFETPHGQKQYKKRMPIVEPRFAYNKYTLHYRQYHLLVLENAKKTTNTHGHSTKHSKNTQHRTKRTRKQYQNNRTNLKITPIKKIKN